MGKKGAKRPAPPAESSGLERRDDGMPKGKPFAPGVSGNPGGRPKDLAAVKSLAGKYTKRAIVALAKILKETPDDKARIAAAEALLNRAWGKPTQAVEVSGPEGGPVESKQEVTFGPDKLRQVLGVLADAGVLAVSGSASGTDGGDSPEVE